jgi:HEPN domain-containing protein
MLRQVGIELPKWHDVGAMLCEYRERFPDAVVMHIERLADISAWLRKEREFSFYGDIDFIPTEEYAREDAERAIRDAQFVVAVAEQVIGG